MVRSKGLIASIIILAASPAYSYKDSFMTCRKPFYRLDEAPLEWVKYLICRADHIEDFGVTQNAESVRENHDRIDELEHLVEKLIADQLYLEEKIEKLELEVEFLTYK